MISIQEIKAEETYLIRKEELRKNMNLTAQFIGDLDVETFHVGLIYNNILASVVSFMRQDYKKLEGVQYQLRGMATKEIYQGKGFGKKLVEKSEKILRKKNADFLWCNARIIALDFYTKLGFKTIGDEFDIPPIGGHFVMIKKLH